MAAKVEFTCINYSTLDTLVVSFHGPVKHSTSLTTSLVASSSPSHTSYASSQSPAVKQKKLLSPYIYLTVRTKVISEQYGAIKKITTTHVPRILCHAIGKAICQPMQEEKGCAMCQEVECDS